VSVRNHVVRPASIPELLGSFAPQCTSEGGHRRAPTLPCARHQGRSWALHHCRCSSPSTKPRPCCARRAALTVCPDHRARSPSGRANLGYWHDGRMLSFDEDLTLALNLADVASSITLGFFERTLRQWSKTDGSLATDADLAVEDALRDVVRAQRPTDAFLGEERGQTGSDSRRWIIDGIDGTVDFAARSPDWGTLIALEVDGRVVVSVCDQPAHARRYWAVKGSGAYGRHGRDGVAVRLQANAVGHLAAARSYLPPARWLPDAAAHRIADAVATATRPTPHTNHPALQVACGGYDVAIFLIAGPWDIAAPSLIVEEAGGRFSDLTGRRRLDSGNAVFTNAILQDEVMKVISAARGDEGLRS